MLWSPNLPAKFQVLLVDLEASFSNLLKPTSGETGLQDLQSSRLAACYDFRASLHGPGPRP